MSEASTQPIETIETTQPIETIETIETVEITATPMASVRAVVPVGQLPAFVGPTFAKVAAAITAQGLTITGPPFGLYRGEPNQEVDVEVGFPCDGLLTATDDVHPGELPGGRAVTTVHVGSYEAMTETYARLTAWIHEHGLRPAGLMWEEYLTDAAAEPDPARWRTRIVWPVTDA